MAKAGLRVFVDADVLFAGAASPSEHSASQVVLRLSEITLIEAICSEQVVFEAKTNLEKKLPKALSTFQLLVERCLDVRDNPSPAHVGSYQGCAHPKDLPLLISAIVEGCSYLVTFNVKDYEPGHAAVEVLRPGEFVRRVRDFLAYL